MPQDYLNNGLAPGDYIFSFEVGIPGIETTVFEVTVTLEDPCDPPIMPEPANLEH